MYNFKFLLLLLLFVQSIFAIELTVMEKKWVKEHPVIKVVANTKDIPFDFINKTGNHDGMSQDYLDIISKKTGLEFKITYTGKWTQLLKQLNDGTSDLITYIIYNSKREDKLNFTEPYTRYSKYFITREGEKSIVSMSHVKDKTFIVVKGYAHQEWLEENYPNIKVIQVQTAYQAIKSISEGKADIFIANKSSSLYIIETTDIRNVKINSKVHEMGRIEIRMATKKEYKPLADIISKVFASLSKEEHLNINIKWINNNKSWQELDGAFGFGRPPYMYDEGSNTGLEMAIVREVLESSGYMIKKTKQLPLASGQKALENDKNLEFSVGIVKDDSDGFYYSDPIDFYNNIFITRKSDNIDLDTLEKLKDKKIASWNGYYKGHKKVLDKSLNLETSKNYKEYINHNKQHDDFFSKKADVIIIDTTIFKWFKHKMSDKYHLSDDEFIIHPLLDDRIPILVAFRDKKIRDDFNIGLKEFKKTDKYKIINRFLK